MRSSRILLFLLIFSFNALGDLRPVADGIRKHKNSGAEFFSVDPFTISKKTISESSALTEAVNEATVLNFSAKGINEVFRKAPAFITLIIPVNHGRPFVLELERVDIYTPDCNLLTASGSFKENTFTGTHYQGIIGDDENSVAAISFFNDEIVGLICNDEGNFVLGRLENNSEYDHIIYNDKDLNVIRQSECLTAADDTPYTQEQLQVPEKISTTNCIRFSWEINHSVFLSKGSVPATTNFATALFNQTALLYRNDNIPVILSEMFIWDIPSPYTHSSSAGLLSQFQSYRNSFNGEMATLLGYGGTGGIAAGFAGVCASGPDQSQCYARIASVFQNIPLYSWSVEVLMHEQGHLMGARHTHACVWNGNGTAIDGCGPLAGYAYEGNCSNALIPSGGTIMSYCHLTSTGIQFNHGYGPQPSTVILNNYLNATCLTSCNGSSCIAPLNVNVVSVTESLALVNWDPVPSALGYVIRYRIAGETSWHLINSSTNSFTIGGLSPGTNYEWNVQSICSEGNSDLSVYSVFTTIPLECIEPVNILSERVTATTALLKWDSVPGAASYSVMYKLSGSTIWNTFVTDDAFIAVSELLPVSIYDWKVSTNCAGGDNSSFTPAAQFTTLSLGPLVTLTLQPDAACGKDALIGSCIPCAIDDYNFGNTSEFNAIAWTSSGASSNNRALIQFDLTSIPAGSLIESATLSLYFDPLHATGQHTALSGPNDALLIKIISPWSEKDVTWNSQPSISYDDTVYIPPSSSPFQDYLNIDVKKLIQGSVNFPEENFGMMLKLKTEDEYKSLLFASSDHPDALRHPKIEIKYRAAEMTCPELIYASCIGTDALISSCNDCGNDAINFGDADEISCIAWMNSGTMTHVRSLLYWDLSFIPSNAIVSSASLSLYAFNSPENGQHSTLSGSNEAWLRRITSSWDENAVTWATQPSVSAVNEVYLPASIHIAQDYTDIDVTPMVQEFIKDRASNYGMMLELNDESAYRKMVFASSDNADPAKHPRLKICYSVPVNLFEQEYSSGITVKQDYYTERVDVTSDDAFLNKDNFSIYNTAGQVVLSLNQLKGNQFSLNRNGLDAGVYFYVLNAESGVHHGKIVYK